MFALNETQRKYLTTVSENKIFITVITVLFILPLFTTDETSSLRSALRFISLILIFGLFTLSFEIQLGRTGLLNFGQTALFGIGAYMCVFYLEFISSFYITTELKIGPVVIPFPLIANFLKDPIIVLFSSLLVAILGGSFVGFIMGLTTNRMHGTAFAFIALAIAMVFYSFLSSNSEGVALSGGETGKLVPTPDLMNSIEFYLFFSILLSLVILVLFITVIFQDIKQRRGFFTVSLYNSPLSQKTDDSSLESYRKTIKIFIFLLLISILVYTVLTIFIPNILGILSVNGFNFYLKIILNYYLVLVCTILTFIYTKLLIHSPFGRVLSAIAQNEGRTKALGYDFYRYKLKALLLSGGIAGLGGGLFALTNTVLNPENTFAVLNTVDVMLFSIVGGLNTLLGPFLGTAFIITSQSPVYGFPYILSVFTIQFDILNFHFVIDAGWWTLFIGIIYILVVMFLPYGIVGTIQVHKFKISDNLRKFRITENDYWIIAFILMVIGILILINFKELVDQISQIGKIFNIFKLLLR